MFVAMRHLDFGEVSVEAGTPLDGIEKLECFSRLSGVRDIVPASDPEAPRVPGLKPVKVDAIKKRKHDSEEG